MIDTNLKAWIHSKDDSFFNNTQRPKQYTKSEVYTLIEHFKTWWTYFGGFNENRRNVYKNENKATSIINRTIYENLPKFFANISNYKNITKKFEIDFSKIEHHHKISLSEVFSPDYFLHTITQSGIDHYNSILGSVVAEDGSSIQGVNIVLNLFSQQQAKNDGTKIPRMATLFKQIMGEKEKKSFVIDGFNNDKELLSELSDSIHNILEHKNDNDKTLIEEIVELFSNFDTYDLTGIYIRKDERFSHLSRQISGTWSIFNEALEEYYINNKKTKDKKEKFVSVDTLIRALEEKEKTLDFENKPQQSYKEKFISHFKNMHIYNKEIEEIEYVCSVLDTSVNAVKPILGLEEFDKDRQIPKKEGEAGGEGLEQIQKIKKLLDTLMHILHLMKTFSLEKIENGEKIQVAQKNEDTVFYSQFNDLYEQLQDNLVGLYNKVRNYVTKKPYTLEKFKINFEKNTLLDGWDVNQEKANLGVLLCKDNQYYLGIMNRKHNKIFESIPPVSQNTNVYKKMNYRDIADASKDIHNLLEIEGVTVRKTGRRGNDEFRKYCEKNNILPQERESFIEDNRGVENLILEYEKSKYLPLEIYRIKKDGTYLMGDKFNKEDCTKFINYYKDRIKDFYKTDYEFDFSDKYESFTDFTNRIASQSYQIHFSDIPVEYIEELVQCDKLHLFEIYNKDFSTKKKKGGKDNLHTLYWKGLFEQANLDDIVLQLNGGAEVFYRPASIDKKITHPKKVAITNNNTNNNKKKSIFEYDLIKDKRFTQDKFFFHVPITLNFKAEKVKSKDFNLKVNSLLQHNREVTILGIDRGEKNLLYYTLIDQQGNILQQKSLNTISNNKQHTSYHTLLHAKEQERKKSRESWSTIGNIKELKNGYISQVVHEITTLAIKNNAIICLENLNKGFKQGRFKIEKQIYQKFEKALIEKLNYLVFKDQTIGKSGHYLKAYQLTNQFQSFQKLGTQSGILFYVPAHHTSKICPRTGFTNFLYPKYENITQAQTFFEKIESITYNTTKKYFEFKVHRDNFINKKEKKEEEEVIKKEWTICSAGGTRWVYLPQPRDYKEIDVHQDLCKLFDEEGIIYTQGTDIKDQIIKREDKKFLSTLIYLLRVLLQLRYNSKKNGVEEDFILSPVADERGDFFDSRKVQANEAPCDSDANGAYHIALKGLWNLHQINKWNPTPNEKGERAKLKLFIKNNEWYNFAQSKPYKKEQ